MVAGNKKLVALLVAVLVAAGGLSWFFQRGKGIVDDTLALQTRLLAGDVTSRDRAAGVTQVTRNVDHMDRDEVKKVRDAFSAEWRRLQRQGIDEFGAAGEADREALLDRDIDRLVTASKLWFATNPRSSGLPPKPRKPKKAAAQPAKAKVSPAAQLFDAYRAALLLRARSRGVSVPEWLLPPR